MLRGILDRYADYFTKHFHAKHHQLVRPYYLQMHNLPATLPCALAPSTLKGCVGTLLNGYIQNALLPQLQTDYYHRHHGRTSETLSQSTIAAKPHQSTSLPATVHLQPTLTCK